MKTGLVSRPALDREGLLATRAFHADRVPLQHGFLSVQRLLVAVVLAFAVHARGGAPVITQQPQSVSAAPGSNVTLSVSVTGDLPMKFKWKLNGKDIPQIITSIAGNGTSGFSGDGGPATQAQVRALYGITVDTKGNIYAIDNSNWRIRKVDTNGIISTYAGNGTIAYNGGDGGPATNAALLFSNSQGLGVDNDDNLLIPDQGHDRLRRVDSNGIITTIAGNGTTADSGDGGYATNAGVYHPTGVGVTADGTMFVCDDGFRVRKIDPSGIISTIAGNGTRGFSGDDGPATNAMVGAMWDLALDQSGNIFVADADKNRVRRIDTNGIITTVAGGGTNYPGIGGLATNAVLDRPSGIAVDNDGNLLIADANHHRICRVEADGTMSVIAGTGAGAFSGDGGPATSAALDYPSDIAVRSDSAVVVADYGNYRIRLVSPPANTPTLLIKNVSVTNVGDYSVVISNANGAITSSIATVSLTGPPQIVTAPTGGTALTGSTVELSVNVTGDLPMTYQWSVNGSPLSQNGPTLLLTNAQPTDTGSYQVVVTNVSGSVTSPVVTVNIGVPPTITVDPVSQTVTYPTNAALVSAATGTLPLTYQWRHNGTSMLGATNATLTISNVIATSAGSYQLLVTNLFGSATSAAATLTVDAAPPAFAQSPSGTTMIYGRAYVLSAFAVSPAPFTYQWRLNGNPIAGATTSSWTVTNMLGALSYSVVAANVYGSVTSSVATVFVEFYESYNFSSAAGFGGATDSVDGTNSTAHFNDPANLCMGSDGNLYVAEFRGDVIRKVARSGTNWVVTTIAGKAGIPGSANGTNTDARFDRPNGIVMDSQGALIVAEYGNGMIRRMTPFGTNWVVTTLASNLVSSGLGGIAVDPAGRIFFSESIRNTVRMLTPTGTNWIISNVAGTNNFSGNVDGTNSFARFSAPDRLAVDAAGNVYVADFNNYSIRKITHVDTNWVVTTFAGSKAPGLNDGPGATARFSYVEGIAFDGSGNLYVADYGNNLVRKVTTNRFVTTLGRKTGMGALFGAAADPSGGVYLGDGGGIIWQGYPGMALSPPPAPPSADYILTNGFPMTLTLPANTTSRLQVSVDLVNWYELTNFTISGQTVSFRDPYASGYVLRFYRLVSP